MSNPHDALFRFTFSQPHYAAQLLRANLPSSIVREIDWSSLQRSPESFVDPELTWRHTDLLFQATLSGREVLIYLLLEHQSTSDPLMPLRLFGYLNRIWQRVVEREPNTRRIPAIIPLVLYHGAKGWRAPTRFIELIELDEGTKRALAPYLPDFTYLLDDLSCQSDERLRSRAIDQLGLLTLLSLQQLPHALDPGAVFERMTDLIAQVVSAPSGMEALTAILCYVFQVSEIEPEVVKQILESKVGQRAAEATMTTAEKLKEQGRAEGEAKGRAEGEAKGRTEGRAEGEAKGRTEGRAEGEAKGRAEGRAEILRKLLTLKFGELSTQTEERLRGAAIDDLDRWSERVLSAQRVEEIFA